MILSRSLPQHHGGCKDLKKTPAIAKAPHILTIQRVSLVSRGLVQGKAKARVTPNGVETCPIKHLGVH